MINSPFFLKNRLVIKTPKILFSSQPSVELITTRPVFGFLTNFLTDSPHGTWYLTFCGYLTYMAYHLTYYGISSCILGVSSYILGASSYILGVSSYILGVSSYMNGFSSYTSIMIIMHSMSYHLTCMVIITYVVIMLHNCGHHCAYRGYHVPLRALR